MTATMPDGIDPVIFNAVLEALAMSERGYRWRRGLRAMRARCEADPEMGTPLDPGIHAHASRAFAEQIGTACAEGERPFVVACIQEMAFIDYAVHRNPHLTWGIA